MAGLNRRGFLSALLASTAAAGISRGTGRASGATIAQTGTSVKAFDTAAYISSQHRSLGHSPQAIGSTSPTRQCGGATDPGLMQRPN